MRISNTDIPGVPAHALDRTGAISPWFWYGSVPITGTGVPWSEAPVGSLYLYVLAGSVGMYAKIADNNAAADWKLMASADGTIDGDLTITGTLTAGDVVVTT